MSETSDNTLTEDLLKDIVTTTNNIVLIIGVVMVNMFTTFHIYCNCKIRRFCLSKVKNIPT